MRIIAQNFTREAIQRAFDEAAEYRGEEWARNKLQEAVGVRNVADIPEKKFMNAAAALVAYTVGVPKPTAEPRVICHSPTVREKLRAMAGGIYGKCEQMRAAERLHPTAFEKLNAMASAIYSRHGQHR